MTSTTAADQTGRILAERGSPRAVCEYAIHQAQGRYREARESARQAFGASGEGPYGPAWWAMVGRVMIARADRCRTEALALAAFDTDSHGREAETYVISSARASLTPVPAFLDAP